MPETSAPTPTPTPTTTPTGNNSVVGTWLYGSARAEWPYEEWTKTNFLYGVAAGLYTFRSDGAYSYQFRSYTGFFDDYVQQQGKYRVDGNRIILFDRTEDYIDFEFPNENYSGKVLGERVLYYQFTQMSNGIEAMNIEASVEALNSESNPPWNWERAN